ncbi:hypothetical protein BJV82DRAFT_707680 [Fennellomyces sp. T-0311]|nr:hypothetical protein BJV82DRAFT_707680 [Fennellomyces sp. T-0311]
MTIALPSSLPILVRASPSKGREFIAKENLAAGTTLFDVQPYATAIFDSFKKRLCARCLCVHPTRFFSLHCHDCDQVYFCSQECSQTYMTDHADSWICPALRKLATLKKVDRHEKSVAKLVLLVYWQRDLGHQDYQGVQQLESHYNDWSTDVKQDWKRIQQFLETQLKHEQEEVMHLISKIESNGFGIYLDGKSDPVARALFPMASLFNHDCNNNCEADQLAEQPEDLASELMDQQQPDGEIIRYYPNVFSQPRGTFRPMLIRTIRPVSAGDPLTISYIDASLPVSARRQKLREDYYFDCQCDRCIREMKK